MSVRVYVGSGTSKNGAPLLVEELSRHLDVDVSGINEHEMRGSNFWLQETSVLVFAGQSVGRFKEALGEDIMAKIKAGVHDGAFDYIGICAGAAFASAKIKYRMKPIVQDKDIIIQNTGLSMFNGLASGPCRSVSPLPFSGGSENLKLITLLDTANYKPYNVFHWGGPALIPLEPIPSSMGRTLSILKSDGTPMSLHLKFGQGKITLCSFHPEIHAGNIHRWAETRFLPDYEAERLQSLASKLDGTAFHRFLADAGLLSPSAIKKETAPAVSL